MSEELTALQPVLVQKQEETAALMVEIEAKLPGVEEQKAVVGADAAVAQAEADKVNAEKESVEADLAEAIPALNEAVKALDTIKQADINEVKNFKKPPETIKLICEAVCVMLSIKPQRIPDPDDPSKRIMDYWGPSQTMLADKEFIPSLKTYDKDNIDPKKS
jgi:dynein heavy chain